MSTTYILYILATITVQMVQCRSEFRAMKFARCRLGPDDVQLPGLSWTECIRSCRERSPCLVANYRRSLLLCVLNFSGASGGLAVCPGYVMSEKENWEDNGLTCSCDDAEGCDDTTCSNTATIDPVFTTANQSTMFGDRVAQMAIDGNTNRNYYTGSCSCTLAGIGQWWMGSLERLSVIDRVVIHNRGDCCADRLNDFSVYVGGELCARLQGEAPQIIDVKCTPGLPIGDSVTLVQNLNIHLTLCEVVVHGIPQN